MCPFDKSGNAGTALFHPNAMRRSQSKLTHLPPPAQLLVFLPHPGGLPFPELPPLRWRFGQEHGLIPEAAVRQKRQSTKIASPTAHINSLKRTHTQLAGHRGVPSGQPLPLEHPHALLLHLPQPGQMLVLGAEEEVGQPLPAHFQQLLGTLRHRLAWNTEGKDETGGQPEHPSAWEKETQAQGQARA